MKNDRIKNVDGEARVDLPFLPSSWVIRTLYSQGNVPNPSCWIVFHVLPSERVLLLW